MAFGLAAADSLVIGAFVNVVTIHFGITGVSWLASTGKSTRTVGANGITTAFTRRAKSLVAFIDIWKEFTFFFCLIYQMACIVILIQVLRYFVRFYTVLSDRKK